MTDNSGGPLEMTMLEPVKAHARGCNCADCKLERQLKSSIKLVKAARGEGAVASALRPRPDQPPPPPAVPSSGYVDLGEIVNVVPFDDAIAAIFAERGMERPGGASGYGWSSRSTVQQCPYKFWLQHRAPKQKLVQIARGPASGREVGSLWHQLLAFRYMGMLGLPTIPNDELRDELLHRNVDSASVMEAYRLYAYYESRYDNDYLRPIAVEVKHEWRGNTCRYDLIAEVDADNPEGMWPGIYNVEHKSAARFDQSTLDGWRNDGEILGQEMVWKGAGLNRKYGKLVGTIVNLESKVKLPEFRRITLAPRAALVKQHVRDLEHLAFEERMYEHYGVWPRRRAACINRFGKCDFYEHCASE